MKPLENPNDGRTDHVQTTGGEENQSTFCLKCERTDTSKPLEEKKGIPTENVFTKKKDHDIRNLKDSTLVKIFSKKGQLRRFFRRLQNLWIRWAGFQVDSNRTASNVGNERAATRPLLGVPGFEEIACIEVEVPDIMSTEVDRIRTTCKECLSHPPDFPSRDQVKSQLIAVDRYFGADSSTHENSHGCGLEHQADYLDKDGSAVHPTWRFILERPLVEQYVLMNNYIRKTSMKYEQQDLSQHKTLVEEKIPEDDSKYEHFTRKHQTDTKRLLRSIHRPKLTSTAVQTTLHLEDNMTNTASELSFYPNSYHSTSTHHSAAASIKSFVAKNDSNNLHISEPCKFQKANSIQEVKWWESNNPPRTSVIYPTSGESASKPNSESGSESLADRLQFTQAKKTIAKHTRVFKGGIAAKLHKVSEMPKRNARKSKKITFSPVIRIFQNPVKNAAAYVIPLGIETKRSSEAELSPSSKKCVQPLIVMNSFFEKPKQNTPKVGSKIIGCMPKACQKHAFYGDNEENPQDKSVEYDRMTQASQNSSTEGTEQSTSSEAIKLKPSPAGFFEPEAVYEKTSFHPEGSHGRDGTTLSVEELKKYFETTQEPDRTGFRRGLKDQNHPSSPLISDRNKDQKKGLGTELPLISDRNKDQEKSLGTELPLISCKNKDEQKGFGTELPLISGAHQEDVLLTQPIPKSDAATRKRHECKSSSSPTTSKYKLNTTNHEVPNKLSNVSVLMQSRVFSLNSMFTASDNRSNLNPPNTTKKSQILSTNSNSQRDQAKCSKTAHVMDRSIKSATSSFGQVLGEQKRTNTARPEPGSGSIRHERHTVKNASFPYNIVFADIIQKAQQIGLLTRTDVLQIMLDPFDASCDKNEPIKFKSVSSSVKSSAADSRDCVLQQMSKLNESRRSMESNFYRKWLTGNVPSSVRKSSSTMKKWIDDDVSSMLSTADAENINSATSSKKLVFQLHKKDVLDGEMNKEQ